MDSTSVLRCNFTTNFTENSSLPCARPLPPSSSSVSSYYDEFFKFAFGSAIFLFISSFASFVANGLLLLVFFFDPLKIFRNAPTYFLAGLAIVDMLTAATEEPMYSTCLMLMYTKQRFNLASCTTLLDIADPISLATINASFLIVFAFTIIQYIVVISPLNHARKVTKTRVIICVFTIYVYAILFSMSPFMGVPVEIQLKYDMIFHNFVLTYLTIIFCILLFVAFKKKMAASRNLREENSSREDGRNNRHTTVERKFIMVNILLIAIMSLCSQPAAFMSLAIVHSMVDLTRPTSLISVIMLNNLTYLRLLLNPFVYAWRIPKYRQALKIVLRCGRKESKSSSTFSDRVVAEMMKSRDTVITLDFKNIPQD